MTILCIGKSHLFWGFITENSESYWLTGQAEVATNPPCKYDEQEKLLCNIYIYVRIYVYICVFYAHHKNVQMETNGTNTITNTSAKKKSSFKTLRDNVGS